MTANVSSELHFCFVYYPKSRFPSQHANDEDSQLIIQNKKGSNYAAEKLATIMDNYVKKHEYLLDNVTQIIPVPNYKSDKQHSKAPLIAEKLAEKIRKRTGKNIHSYVDILERVGNSRNKWDNKEARMLSAESDYKIADYIKNNNSLISNNNLLLLDDILTSGATTTVCSRLLRNNGANNVSIFCAARTIK